MNKFLASLRRAFLAFSIAFAAVGGGAVTTVATSVVVATSAQADVGPVEGRHAPGTRQTTFEPLFGFGREADSMGRVQRLCRAGVLPPTAAQYATALGAIRANCANCFPSAAVQDWIARGSAYCGMAPQVVAPVQRVTTHPREQRVVNHPQQAPRVVEQVTQPIQQTAPTRIFVPQPMSVNVICQTCYFGR